MNLLLDTHTLLWAMSRPSLLSKRAREAIAVPEHVRYVSIVSLWELAVLKAIGKVRIETGFERFVGEYLHTMAAHELGLGMQHVIAVSELPLYHRDPFDRMLVAQAQVEGLVFVTADDTIAQYGVNVLWD